ncbi:uncharacterized protein PV07_12573 [Cladophialophora immunda]|uniref:Uncharacterized protein n=1 Tax=Cladophialophora immunda TaxID=569365 RepID=A0A0D2BSP1_9EURO|nr:uncharacterized protein PV07_12573 [Cladophialophora immunda]KIW22033.1 hypothetical protein PV07_12573 [Cladophialophora immunda]
MVTRGFHIVLCGRRYFVYGYDGDAYPSGLGRNIVDDIPNDERLYQDWLQREREKVKCYVADLEKTAFTVTKSTLAKGRSSETLQDTYEPTWSLIDGLTSLPSSLCDVERHEWIYLVDLDSELFSINNWMVFELDDIPRDRWIPAVLHGEGEERDGQKRAFELCPEAGWRIDPPDYFPLSQGPQRDEYRSLYRRYDVSIVAPIEHDTIGARTSWGPSVAGAIFHH